MAYAKLNQFQDPIKVHGAGHFRRQGTPRGLRCTLRLAGLHIDVSRQDPSSGRGWL
jgi:hypothetical protein